MAPLPTLTMPTRKLATSPVFRNRTNSGVGESTDQHDKETDRYNSISEYTASSEPALFAATSTSAVSGPDGARTPQSPPAEDVGRDEFETDYVIGSHTDTSDPWVVSYASPDTSSWRPSSSATTLASSATGPSIAPKPTTPVSEAVDDKGDSGNGDTRTNSTTTSLATCDDVYDGISIVLDADILMTMSSDPLRLFASSSSYIPSTLTPGYSTSMDSLASSTLPGAASTSRSFSEEQSAVETDVDEDERPSKRRRQSSDSTLPPSDLILSPTISGSSATPSLPTASSPALPTPKPASTRSTRRGILSSAVSDSGEVPTRRASERLTRPSEKQSPRSFVASSSSSLSNIPTTRRSGRNQCQYHPLGPRHLEYDYHVAWEELREATLLAARAVQYPFPDRASLLATGKSADCDELVRPTLALILEAKFPHVEKARRKLNEADRILQEALDRGETWENTAVPDALLEPTYEALDAATGALALPLKQQTITRSRARDQSVCSCASTAPREISAPRPKPVPSKGNAPPSRVSLAHKPKPIIGKRRRVVLSSESSKLSDD